MKPSAKENNDYHNHPDINVRMIAAAEDGMLERMNHLIEQGADIHAYRDGAIRWATRDGHIEVVQELLRRGCNPTIALLHACKSNRYDMVQLLIQYGADVNMKNECPLRIASEEGHTRIVRLLVENGANVHIYDDYPLRIAAGNGHLDTVHVLLSYGANSRAYNNGALRRAKQGGHHSIVQLLLTSQSSLLIQ